MTNQEAEKYYDILEEKLSKEDFEDLHPTLIGGLMQVLKDVEQRSEPVSLKRIVMAMDVDEISGAANEKIKADQKLNGMEIQHEVLPAHARFILEAIKEQLP